MEDGFVVANKPKEIDFEAEYELHAAKLHSSIGCEVPLSHIYVRGAKPTLVAIEGDLTTLKFANWTIMTRVPIRYLCDEAGYWRN